MGKLSGFPVGGRGAKSRKELSKKKEVRGVNPTALVRKGERMEANTKGNSPSGKRRRQPGIDHGDAGAIRPRENPGTTGEWDQGGGDPEKKREQGD